MGLTHVYENTKCTLHMLTKPSYGDDLTKCISKYVDQTLPCQQGLKVRHNMFRPNPFYTSEDTKCISTRVTKHTEYTRFIAKRDVQTLPLPASTQKIKTTCVDQTPPIPARTQNVSQLVLTKHIPCQRGHIK